jgi:cytochrome b
VNTSQNLSGIRHLVWDAPVRLVHLLLIVGFSGAYAIAETSDDGPLFSLHMVLGLLLVVVVLFRVVWGIVGTRHARFGAFAWSPRALLSYLSGVATGRGSPRVGHNPATSYATLAILLLLLGIGATGLLMTTGGGEALEEVHEVLVVALLVVAVLHVAGVIVHTLRYRDDIVLSMIDGKKAIATKADATRSAWGASVVLLGLAAGTIGLGLAGYDAATGVVVIPGTGWRLGESEGDHAKDGEHDEKRDHGEHEDDD